MDDDKLQMAVTGKTTIFRHDYNGKAFYKMSKPKNINGEWVHGDIDVYFRKGVEVSDRTKIIIRSGWLDYYKKDKDTVWYVFVNEFVFEGAPKSEPKPKPEPKPEPKQMEVPNNFEAVDEDVPF